MLTFRSQTELWIDDTRVTNSDTHQDVANKPTVVPNVHHDTSNAETIVSGIRSDAANTPTVVSDIHRSKLKSREGVDGRNQLVNAVRTLPVIEYSCHRVTESYHCLDSCQVSDLGYN